MPTIAPLVLNATDAADGTTASTSPAYVPTSPAYVPTSPDYVPTSHGYESTSRGTSPAAAVQFLGSWVQRSSPCIPSKQGPTQSGLDPQAHELAKMFMDKMGNLARKCRTRGQLSELYLTTIASWATNEVQKDERKQRHFKQVLFAIAHGMKLVRVKNSGQDLFWNRYRDNQGNQIEEERAKFDERRQQSGFQGDRRGFQGDHSGYQGDRRGFQGDRRGPANYSQ